MAKQGTDGARGEYINIPEPSSDPHALSNGDVAGYSMALTELIGPSPVVVIGRDTRPSGEVLKRYATAGIEAAGGVVIDVGVAPTPAIQKIAVKLGAEGAISLTPSHNPHTDAGWKGMFGAEKPSKSQVADIETGFRSIIARGVLETLNPQTYDPDKHEQTHHVATYMQDILHDVRSIFGSERPLDGKIIVADAARGAANAVTPVLLEHLGAEVVRFACDTDGLVNDNCGATHLGGLQQFLRGRPELVHDPRFVGAVANDGDADRFMGLGATAASGEPRFYTLDGNIALELKASRLAEEQMTPGKTGVVSTEYVNGATARRIEASGLQFVTCPNGDVNVTKALRERGWLVGAEPSGHIVDLRLGIPSGDGVQNAIWATIFAATNGTNFAEICRERRLDPDYLMNVRLPQGQSYDAARAAHALRRTRRDEANMSDVLVRASGTEPVVRVRVTGKDARATYGRAHGIARAIARAHS